MKIALTLGRGLFAVRARGSGSVRARSAFRATCPVSANSVHAFRRTCSGIGLLTENLNVPVVPVKIEGLFDLTEQRRYFSRPGTVTVTFGEPLTFERGIDPVQITKELEARVREL